MSKMLWACGYEVYKDILDLLPFHFKQKGYDLEIKEKYNKKGFLTEIYKSTKYDIIILGESMENTSFDVMTLENISQFMTDSIFIYIIKDTHKGTPYVRDLINAEIYNVLFQKDVSLDSIADLIDNPRKRLEAKIYLGYEEIQESSNNNTSESNFNSMESMVEYLKSIPSEKRLSEFELLAQNLSVIELGKFLDMLPVFVLSDIEECNLVKKYKKDTSTESPKVLSAATKILKKVPTSDSDTSTIVPEIVEVEIIKEKIKGTIFIVFAGADTNIGCTHAAYSTAYYLSRQGYKTAYIEMCDDPIFFKGYKDDSTVKEIEGGYTVEKNLDLYVKYLNGRVEYGKAVSNGYTYIVIDLGCIFRKDTKGNLEVNDSLREMERANVPILVGAGSKWQLENIVQASKLGHENWKLYINFADKDNEKGIIKTIKDITNKEVFCAPYTPNCFKIYQEQDEFLDELLKEVLPAKNIKKPGLVNKIFNRKNRR